ncbi:hypothetical protein PIB30_035276 [Stylosanthes scabra]|uniref:Uncharacterized protein n=1 Tax=Stylosanthes scabra TaxID=79078 RepID=A0ABU6XEE6_9FABA|nr:hypothetical protein [Stylosanthes scabra]
MNPYDERRLIDEVIYLHSLWHQGPPQTPPPPPPPNPILTPTQLSNCNNILFPSQHYFPKPHAPHFNWSPSHLNPHHQHPPPIPLAPPHTGSLLPASNNKRKKKKNKNNKGRGRPRSPGLEWPCPAPPDPTSTGWPAPKKPRLEAPAVSPEEKERLAALQAQNKASQAFKEFMLNCDDSDCDDIDDEDDDDVELEEYEEYFLRIFKEDDELRSYYQRRFENGEFCCLVCDAVGKKNSGKKYKDCVSLLQHAKSVLRTLKKGAHRAFAQAVCKVFGWDIDHLPVIATTRKPLGSTLNIRPSNAEDEVKGNADDGEGGTCKQHGKVSLENNDQPVEERVCEGEQSVIGCSIIQSDLDKKDENLDEKILDIKFESGEGGAMTKASLEHCDSDAGWVCKNPNTDSSSTASVWPLFETNSSHCTSSLSEEENASVAVQKLQHKALKVAEKYLVANAGSDSDDDDSDEEDEDD